MLPFQPKFPAGLNNEGHRFSSVLLLGTSNKLLFHLQISVFWPNSFEVSVSVKSYTAKSSVGWLLKADKTKGPISSVSHTTTSLIHVT